MAPNSPDWAARYLRRQARAYENHRATLPSVQGAVKMAILCQLSSEQIAAILREHGLDYDADTQAVVEP